MLDKAAAPTSDGPASRQIQDLKAELLKLKGLLAEKAELLQQAVVSPTGISVHSSVVPSVSWKDKVVAGETAVPRMALQYFAPSFVKEKLVVSPPEEVVHLGSEKWKDCVVGYFIDLLQLPSDEVLPDEVDPLPSEAEFHDGLIQGLKPDIIPPAQKGKGRNKGRGRREAGVGVPEHGLDGVIPVDSAPPAARLPHPVQHSAYLDRIVPVPHPDPPVLADRDLAPDRSRPPESARVGTGPRFGASGSDGAEAGEGVVNCSCH
ncbi:hypothetical protein RHMOL_Rhmol13G0138500 [Rhododendron molle]|uniref:Uncharacterized protein n=1 Tax=Rhododendron molle TaxID=49168 RepID=A0ACC0L7S9_RHOML|nr:hypothetical protein RHMOL_Rhmol13G0138500 [Rhododendron molle]